MTAGEIYSLQLKADLVVLSACNTGGGNITGDGVLGLSRSWMAAGVPRLILSLWTVNDLSTCLLMAKFYQMLNDVPVLKSGDVARLLQQAQIWLKDVTKEELEEQLLAGLYWSVLSRNQRAEIEDWLDLLAANAQPFQSPRYWAAFCVIGH